jgi:hypothetical protein
MQKKLFISKPLFGFAVSALTVAHGLTLLMLFFKGFSCGI